MKEVLQEWINWMNTYSSLIGPRPELVELINKTVGILSVVKDRNDELEKYI